MPRKARERSATGIYHAMLRGINGQQIFEDAEDNDRFLEEKSKTWRMSDAEAKEIKRKLFGFDTVNAFQASSEEIKCDHVKRLLSESLSIRQISRLTGISKGIVEKYGKR